MIIVTFGSILLGGYFYLNSMQLFSLEEELRRVKNDLDSSQADISAYLDSMFREIKLLAGSKEIQRLLVDEDSKNIAAVNSKLDFFKNTLRADVCYLMNAQGLTLASSNRKSKSSFVGKNYSFRPYFIKAARGLPTIYMAIGVTSHKRGIYCSYPVILKETDVPAGVVVIKHNTSLLKRIIDKVRNDVFMVVGPYGVIFLTNHREWLNRSLWKLSDSETKVLKTSHQFGAGPWKWTGMSKKNDYMAVDTKGDSYYICDVDISSMPGWKMILLRNKHETAGIVFSKMFKTFGTGVATVCIIMIILFSWLYIQAFSELRTRLLHEEELDKLYTAMEQSSVSVIITDVHGNITYVNPNFVRVSGYSREEVMGKNPRFLKGGSSPEVHRELWETIKAGKVWLGELQNKKKNGEIFYEDVSISPVRNRDGKISSFIAVKEDITFRIEAERRLRESETFLRNVMNSILSGLVLIDPETHEIIQVNDYAASKFGTSKEEMEGRICHKYICTSGENECPITDLGEDIDSSERTLIRADGSQITILKSVSEVQYQGCPILVENFVDITPLKLAIEQAELMAVKAEESAQARTMFLANMSHEIRTPMNSIMGFLELALEKDDLSQVTREYLKTALQSAKDLLILINDILDITKLESGMMELDQTLFNVSELLSEVKEVLNFKATAKSLDFNVSVDPALSGDYIGDPTRLKQVVLNLTDNAIKFTNKGSVTITVVPENDIEQLHFTISDTGIGIDSDNQKKIFEAFAQEDGSTTRRFGGTGLGTTIAKQIVESMNGEIWVESEVGKGSVFHFIMRLEKVPDELGRKNLTETIQPEEPEESLKETGGLTILVAEDVEVNVKLLESRLKQKDYKVVIARNGSEAITAFKNGGIDLILMDVHMPEIDGLEATKCIRSMEEKSGSHVPIVAMTASVMPDEQRSYLQAGMDIVVEKPTDFNKLMREISRLTGNKERNKKRAESSGKETAGGEQDKRLVKLKERFKGLMDVDDALDRWNNIDNLIDALLKVPQLYGRMIEDIQKMIKENRIKEAVDMTHKLKGISGMLSLVDVFQDAGNLEAAFRQDRLEIVDGLIERLNNSFNKSIKAFKDIESI